MKVTILTISIVLTILPNLASEIPPQKSSNYSTKELSYLIPFEKSEIYKRIKYGKFYESMYKWSSRVGVPLEIVFEVIKNESSFNHKAFNVNRNGTMDEGLMQLNSSNYEEFKWRFNENKDYNPYDPDTNIRIGCSYLSWLYNNKKIGKKNWYNVLVFWNGSKQASKVFAKKVLSEIK